MPPTDRVPLSPEEVAEIRERADAATPGPWDSGPLFDDQAGDYCVWISTEPGEQREFLGNVGGVVEPVAPAMPENLVYFDAERADAEFIAHARTDIPRLLDALEAERSENERLRSDLSAAAQSYGGLVRVLDESAARREPGGEGT